MTGYRQILKGLAMQWLFCIGALVCLSLSAVASWAGCSEFALVDREQPELTVSEATNPSIVLRQRTVFINPDLVLDGQFVDSIRLNLFEDVHLRAIRNKTQRGSRGSILWTGALVGVENGTVVLIIRDQRVSATVFLPSATYQVRPLDKGLHLIRQLNNPAIGKLEKTPPGMRPDELKIVELVNRERTMEGLPTLQCSETLSTVSRNHATDMALGNYYSHDRRDGRKFYERIFDTGYPVSKCGENIAVGFSTAEEVFEGWINSPEHRANILNSDFTEIGIGSAVGNNRTYWAQEFGAGKRPGYEVLKLASGPSPLQLFRTMTKIFGSL